MAIDFPASPTNGQTFVVGSVTYTYDGTKWTAVAAGGGGGGGSRDKIEEGNTSAEVIDTGTDGRFVVTTEGSEALRVNPSGRLLVGTPTNRTGGLFQIETSASDASRIHTITNNASNTISAVWKFIKTRGTSNGASTLVQSGDSLGFITFAGTDGTNTVDGAYIGAEVDAAVTASGNEMPTRLSFSTTAAGASVPTERMRITNDGYVLFSTTNKTLRDSTGDIGISIDPGLGGLLQVAAGGPTFFNRVGPSDGDIIKLCRNGAHNGSISVTTSATAYNTSSDYRLKENVTAVTDGITRLQQLKPSRFNFITEPGKTVDGFLAHEAQAVVPECVTGTKDAVDDDGKPVYQGIDQSKLVPLLTAALQEAIGEIESLKARVTALETPSH